MPEPLVSVPDLMAFVWPPLLAFFGVLALVGVIAAFAYKGD